MSKIDWKAVPSLASLRAFELTARSGSFASAARELNVTHAAIAQRVRALETDLGVQLARRAGRTVVLTEAGERLAQQLTEGFGTIASGVRDLRNTQSTAPLQITATVHFSQSVILPRLHEFWRDHPEIQISVMPSQDVEDMSSLGLDLAIRGTSDTPDWPGVKAEPLFESDLIAVGAPAIVNDDKTDLAQKPWIWTAGAKHDEAALAAFGLKVQALKNVDIGVPFLQLSLAKQGLGLLFSPEILVQDELISGELCKVPVPSRISVTYYAVTPLGAVGPYSQIFVSWLRKTMATPEEIKNSAK